MSDQTFILQLQAGIGALLDVVKGDLQCSSEDEAKFSLRLDPDTRSLKQILESLAPHSQLFSITLTYEVQQWAGDASLSINGLSLSSWNEDTDLSPEDLNTEARNLLAELVHQLGQINQHMLINDFTKSLNDLVDAGGSVKTSVTVYLAKQTLMSKLEWPQGVRGILYVGADKLLNVVHNTDISAIGKLLIPDHETTLIVMLGNVSGVAKGPNIRIVGKNHWDSLGEFDFHASEEDSRRIRDAISFRSDEGHWEVPTSGLTPFHLFIGTQTNSLDSPNIPEAISRLRDRLRWTPLSRHEKGLS